MSAKQNEFIQIIEAHQGILHKICKMYCKDIDDKKDLMQEMMMQLWRSYDNFQSKSKISSWIYQVALNTAITQVRKRYKMPIYIEITNEVCESCANEYDDTTEKTNLLYCAIEKLSGIEKAFMTLYFDNQTYEEMALILGITQNNVRVKMHRIQEKLKTILNPSKS